VLRITPERLDHARTKGEASFALHTAVRRVGAKREAFGSGAGIQIDEQTVYAPDGVVVCGPRLPADAILLVNPVIVVEVLSPSTAADDHGVKLDGYFSLGSVSHYLILDPDRRVMIHHRRGHAGAIETRVLREGKVVLDPPGFDAQVAEFFATE
jgi:Uma2 family endonuclease